MPTPALRGVMPMPPGPTPDREAAMTDLDSTSGADVAVMFLSAMSHHHTETIRLTGPVLMGSHHADLTPRTGVRFWTRTAGPVPTWCAA